MPAAVAAPWQSCPDHPLVGMETAAPGPSHAMPLPETPSDACSSSATVILGRATTKKLEHLSSESLRKEFHRCFHTSMSDELLNDLQTVVIFRDALSHGYISLLDQIINSGREHLFWSPRPSPSSITVALELRASESVSCSGFQGMCLVPPAPPRLPYMQVGALIKWIP